MAKTLSSLVDRVFGALKTDYKEQVSLSAGVSAATTCQTLTVSDARKIVNKDQLEVDSELILATESPKTIDYLNHGTTTVSAVYASATAIKAGTSSLFTAGSFFKMDAEEFKISKVSAIGTKNLKVVRGVRGTSAVAHDNNVAIQNMRSVFVRRAYQGSTAAYHASAAVGYVVDGWSRWEILEALKRSMESLYKEVSNDFIGQTRGQTNKKIVDDMDTAASWTASAQGTSPALDTSDKKEGTASIKIGATGVGSGTYSAAPSSFDMTGYDYLNVWIYLKDRFDSSENAYVGENALSIRLGNDATNYYSWNVGRDALLEGAWTLVSLPIAEAATTGTVVLTAIDYAVVTINASQAITSGDMKMDAMWLSTFPYTTDVNLRYRLPTGIALVNEIRILRDEASVSDYWDCRDYKVEGKYLLFPAISSSWRNCPIQVIGQKAFTVPSAVTTALDIDDEIEELLIVATLIKCYESKIAEVVRSDKLSAKFQETNVLYLDREKRRLNDRYDELLPKARKAITAKASWFDHG